MLGWSISASACRSASKRAMHLPASPCPALMILSGDLAPDGLGLLGHVDGAHAAFADLLQQLVRPAVPARSAAGAGGDWVASPLSGGAWRLPQWASGLFQKAGSVAWAFEQGLHLGLELVIPGGSRVKVGGLLTRRSELQALPKIWLSFTGCLLPTPRRPERKPPTVFSSFFHFAFQPGLGIGPVGLGGRLRDAEYLGHLRQSEAGEVAELHQPGPAG